VLGALTAGCPPTPGPSRGPQDVTLAYLEATRAGDLKAAWALLPPRQRGPDPETFRPRFEELREALLADTSAAPSGWHLEVVVPADGAPTRLPLAREHGRWWVDAAAARPGAQAADQGPREALEVFVEALRQRRYGDLWAVMPAQYRAELGPEQLAQRLGARQEEMDRLAAALLPLLNRPMDLRDDLAWVSAGPLRVRLRRQADGRWMVEDPGWAPAADAPPADSDPSPAAAPPQPQPAPPPDPGQPRA